MDLGASGFLLKDNAISEITSAVRAAAQGNVYVTASLTSYLLTRRRATQDFTQQTPSINFLTQTEKQVLKMVADYKSSKEIADELFIHRRTVENHRNNISRKLDLRGHKALLKFALKHKHEL